MSTTIVQRFKAALSFGQQGEEESGRSVHKWYRNRIRTFQELIRSGRVAEADFKGLGIAGDDELGRLFDWCRQRIVFEASTREQLMKERDRADGQSKEVERLLAEVEQLNETVARRESRLESASRKRQQMQSAHADELGRVTLEHSREMHEAAKRFEAEKQKLESEKRHIQAQLLVSHDQSYAWPDEKLRVQFLELCRLLNNATANLAASIDIPLTGFGRRLDPDDTFRITGPTGAHFWLRSRLWAAVEAGFFSRPYGFGAFGPGKGAREVMDVFNAWASRLHTPASGDPDDAISIFRTDETANRWRSVTFQSLSTSGSLAAEGRANAERVAVQLHGLLSAIASACNAAPCDTPQSDLRQAAHLAFELALQCGINPAMVSLLSTARGASVVMDRAMGFQDCEDGRRRGQSVVAALVVQPGWTRTGGEGGSGRRTVIVPCEVFTGS